uniref:NADH-ubiquinone oxidoreductase chain 6 n=1 Tax=Paracercion v-nigrum TaxID=1389458 RepID=A0A650FH04_9ODON|nr:NADH dehydrogenase subunit 6 [Paracercion v-nigrum]
MSQLLFFMNTVNSTIFSTMKHPMSMGLCLLTQTVFVCLITNNIAQNAWFSYILFLVFLGGMLVLFIYMTSVASNELFLKTKIASFVGVLMINMLVITMLLMLDPMLLNNNTEEMMEMNKFHDSSTMAISMFNYPNNILTTVMVLYLFLTLIVVVKITEAHQGPLRSTN